MRVGGWIEFQDLTPIPYCDDGTMKEDDAFHAFAHLAVQGMHALGCRRFGDPIRAEELEKAGFENVHVVVKKVPIGPWARDGRLKTIGTLMKTVMVQTIPAYLAKPFDALELAAQERDDLRDMAVNALDDRRVHRYMNMRFVFGQKGPDPAMDFGAGTL